MSIYGTCKTCGHETQDYECLNCMRGKLFALQAVAATAREYLRNPVKRHDLERALEALDNESQAAE